MADEALAQINTYFRVCDAVRVRFADTKADADVTVLMLARWPETCGRSDECGIVWRRWVGSSPSSCLASATPTVAQS